MSHTYDFPRPALTVDAIVLTHESPPRVLLIQRKTPPCAGAWAFPGGFVNENERLDDAVRRELHEETGLQVDAVDQLGAYGDPDRDSRGWTVTVAYVARVNAAEVRVRAGDDAAEVSWHSSAAPPDLAFDHARILGDALKRVRAS